VQVNKLTYIALITLFGFAAQAQSLEIIYDKNFEHGIIGQEIKTQLKINTDALDLLEAYHWPGNVRELRHIIERAVIMCEDDVIGSGDIVLHGGRQAPVDIDSTNLTLEEMEIQLVTRALAKHKGNISKTAAELGITRASLYRRLDKFDI